MSFAKNNFPKNRWSVELQDLTEPATGLVILQNHSKAKMSPWYLLFKLLIKNITYSNLANMYQHRYTFYGWIPTLVCVGKDSGKRTEKVHGKYAFGAEVRKKNGDNARKVHIRV